MFSSYFMSLQWHFVGVEWIFFLNLEAPILITVGLMSLYFGIQNLREKSLLKNELFITYCISSGILHLSCSRDPTPNPEFSLICFTRNLDCSTKPCNNLRLWKVYLSHFGTTTALTKSKQSSNFLVTKDGIRSDNSLTW